mgnify:CR=1 FL=1
MRTSYRDNFAWLLPHYLVLGIVAGGLAVIFAQLGITAPQGFGGAFFLAKILNTVGADNITPKSVASAAAAYHDGVLLGTPKVAFGSNPQFPTLSGMADRIYVYEGDGKWDVIHFNFGLHDAKYNSEMTQRASREQYIANLKSLIAQMKATGAKLVFATTTPVPMGGVLSPTRKFDSVEARNELAVQLMLSSEVAIDDLYATAKPIMEKHGRPNDVHFAPEGYEVLATAVAASIESALAKR